MERPHERAHEDSAFERGRPRPSELLVTSSYTDSQLIAKLGRPDYSYRIVARAFAPLLTRWAPMTSIEVQNDLVRAAQIARQRGACPIHISFLPVHAMTVCSDTINVGVPAWEFPNIPCTDLGGDPRSNWLRRSNDLDVIITHTTFSRSAFLAAGVTPPVHVVPVPAKSKYFDLEPWHESRTTVLDCPCFELEFDAEPTHPVVIPVWPPSDEIPHSPPPRSLLGQVKRRCIDAAKSVSPQVVIDAVRSCKDGIAFSRDRFRFRRSPIPHQAELVMTPRTRLSGVVYTTILNPFDGRKNWEDLLTGFMAALGPCPDATLVLKLVTSPAHAKLALHHVVNFCRGRRFKRTCRMIFITDFLADDQLIQLAEASTFYVNTSRAEGSCLPLQDFLAAGRPCLAPPNTGMMDSVFPDSSFPIDSHPEPTCFPQDPEFRTTTVWNRIVWKSVFERFRESYRVAREDRQRLRTMAQIARERMVNLVSHDAVWPRLRDALNDALHSPNRIRMLGVDSVSTSRKVA